MSEILQEKIDDLKEMLAGEIVLAPDVSSAFKKWRNIFEIGQKKLAIELGVKVSTISDYENGRRHNPGSQFVKKYVDALFKVDLARKGQIILSLIKEEQSNPFTIKEFKKIILPQKLFKAISLYDINSRKFNEGIYGITYIDTPSIKDFDFGKYPLMYGRTNKRILFFSKTTDLIIIDYTLRLLRYLTGQSPVAIIIEDENPEANVDKYKIGLHINVPLFLSKTNKDGINDLMKF